MPEILEVEAYRRAAERVVGRSIARVVTPDSWYVKGATSPSGVRRALTGTVVNAVRRTGKMLLLDNDRGLVLGLRFGMTGRLIVDEMVAIDGLEYGPRARRALVESLHTALPRRWDVADQRPSAARRRRARSRRVCTRT